MGEKIRRKLKKEKLKSSAPVDKKKKEGLTPSHEILIGNC
jgi:hypothetical protein